MVVVYLYSVFSFRGEVVDWIILGALGRFGWLAVFFGGVDIFLRVASFFLARCI